MKKVMERVAKAKAKITEITIVEFLDSDSQNRTIIDVRESHEHINGNIVNSINIPRGIIEFEINKHCEEAGSDTEIVLYCKSGGRSALAAESLQELGYSKIVSLAGGFDAWDKHNK